VKEFPEFMKNPINRIKQSSQYTKDIAIQSDNKLVVVGNSMNAVPNSDMVIWRYK
jgi:hypothetical protein